MESIPQAPRLKLLADLQGQPWKLTEEQAVDFIAWLNGIAPMRAITIHDFSTGDVAYAIERLKVLAPAEALSAWQAKRADDERPKTRAEITAEGRQWLRFCNPVTGDVYVPVGVGGSV